MNKFVFTGGPCSGKTKVLNKLNKQGFHALRETAKGIVAKRRDIPMTKEESDIRQELIFKTQFAKEKRAERMNYHLLFLDRCLIDGLGYSLLYAGEKSIEKYIPFVEKQRYNSVFLFELLDFDSEGFRAEKDKGEARRIEESIYTIYKRFGYDPIYVPKMSLNKKESINKRLDFVLGKVFDRSG